MAQIAFFEIRSGRPDAGRKEVCWAEGQSPCLLEGGRSAKEIEWQGLGQLFPEDGGSLGFGAPGC